MSASTSQVNHQRQNAITPWTSEETLPIQELPLDLIYEIFSHLDLASLAAASRVNRDWRALAGTPILWKKAIYREFAFSSEDWAKALGEDAVKGEDRQAEFTSLPSIEEFRKAHAAFPGKKLTESHFLVRSPKTLCGGVSIRSLGQLFKRYFPGNEHGYRYIGNLAMEQHGDKAIEKSCWLLGPKEPVPETRHKIYHVQKAMVAKLAERAQVAYEVPEVVDIVICVLAEYIRSGKRLLSDNPWTYTRCKEKVQAQVHSGNFYQLIVGGFGPSGPDVYPLDNYFIHDHNAVAPLRKF